MRPSRRLPATLLAAALLAGCGAVAPSVEPAGTAGTATPPTSSASPVAGPGSACSPPSTPPAEAWNGGVWYEAFVRSFADGSGDGIGDLRGLTARLDHLNDGDPATTDDLGVTGIWLMPVAESPSYHGYDVTDYRAVEPDYGTLDDMRAFLEAAHERGITVIVDLVLNHTSVEHPWFVDARRPGSAHGDWYVWEDERPTFLGPGGQVVWHPDDGRWYYGVFWEGMPDLDLREPEVTAELRDVARFWLEDVGVDGFRLDAAKHLIEDGKVQTNTPETLAWLAGFRTSVKAVDPEALLVGEVWDPPTIAAAYVPDSVDMTFDFGLAAGIRLALQNGRAAPLRTGLADSLAAWPAGQNATFLTNHDLTRIMTELGGDIAAAKLAAFILLTAPGTPFLYYGEEIGMTGTKPDERIRTPMRWTPEGPAAGFSAVEPWQPLSEDPAGVDVATQSADPDSLLSTYRELVRLRTSTPALGIGATSLLDGGAEPVIGWLRTTADATRLVVVNVSDEPVAAYGLTVDEGPLCGAVSARLVATMGGDPGAPVVAPAVTPRGGLEGYMPLPVLAPRSGYVIALEPAP